MLKEITAYLDSKTALTEGTDLFAGHYEADLDDDITVVESLVPGLADALLHDLWQVPFRVYSRSLSFFTAHGTAQTVFALLHGKEQITLPVVGSGPTYLCSVTGTTPAYLGKDEKGRHQFAVNFVFITQQT